MKPRNCVKENKCIAVTIINNKRNNNYLNDNIVSLENTECKGCVAQRIERLSRSGKDAGSNNHNKYLNISNEADSSVVERARSLTDKAPDSRTGRCEFENDSEVSPRSHLYDKKEEINQAHSPDKTLDSRTGISHEFYLDSEIAESHTLRTDRNNNYKNLSISEKTINIDKKIGGIDASDSSRVSDCFPPPYESLSEESVEWTKVINLEPGMKIAAAEEDGRAINTTAEHPYLVKLYSKDECDKFNGEYCTRWVELRDLKEGNKIAVPNIENNYLLSDSDFISSKNISTNSGVENTLTSSCFLKSFSPDQMPEPSLSTNAEYGASLLCGANFSAFSLISDEILPVVYNSIFSLSIWNDSMSSCTETLPLSAINSLLFSNSAINFNGATSLILFSKNNSCVLPLPIRAANSTLASTTNSIYFASLKNLSATALFILSANSFASLPDNLIFDENAFNFFNCSVLSKNALVAISDQSNLNSFIVLSSSSGILTFNSAILTSPTENNKNNYLKSSILKTRFLTKTLYIKLIISRPQKNTINLFHKFNANPLPTTNISIETESGIFPNRIFSIKFVDRNTRTASKVVYIASEYKKEYPLDALREAIINAIIHRDYKINSNVRIAIFNDRIEVISPGGLLPGLKIEKLEGAHELRNKLLAHYFYDIGEIEKWGSGIYKMNKLMKAHGLKKPAYETNHQFKVTFVGPGEKITGMIKKPEPIMSRLNERQKKALHYIAKNQRITREEYTKINKISNATSKRDLKELASKGIITKKGTGPGTYYILSNDKSYTKVKNKFLR